MMTTHSWGPQHLILTSSQTSVGKSNDGDNDNNNNYWRIWKNGGIICDNCVDKFSCAWVGKEKMFLETVELYVYNVKR